MKRVAIVILTFVFFLLNIHLAYAGKMHFYKNPEGDVYRICKNKDGYIVYKPNGGQDMHGRGYSWREVTQQYRLGKYYKRSSQSYDDCP